jgi:hypothetical protein
MQANCSISARIKTSPTYTRVIPPSPPLAAVAQALVVDRLAMILAWSPTIAMILGKVVTRLWPHFRRV